MMSHGARVAAGRLEKSRRDQPGARAAEYVLPLDAVAEAMPSDETRCVWAVNPIVSTVFASSAFARLVGIERRVLRGQPWFVVLPITSLTAVEWLVHSTAWRPAATLDLRHLEGEYIAAVLSRVSGGPGHDYAVFNVSPLGRRVARTAITALPADVDPFSGNQAFRLARDLATGHAMSGPHRRQRWIRTCHVGD
jgi:hypothetical protein